MKNKKLKADRKVRRKKRRHDKSRQHESQYEPDVKNVYFEDRHRDKGNNNIDTFCPRARPLYDISKKCLGLIKYKQPKKHMFHRYYVKNIDSTAPKKKDSIIKRTSVKETLEDEVADDVSSWCKNLEEEQKHITRNYNEQLTEEPHNIELWLQYIAFQVPNTFYFI